MLRRKFITFVILLLSLSIVIKKLYSPVLIRLSAIIVAVYLTTSLGFNKFILVVGLILKCPEFVASVIVGYKSLIACVPLLCISNAILPISPLFKILLPSLSAKTTLLISYWASRL